MLRLRTAATMMTVFVLFAMLAAPAAAIPVPPVLGDPVGHCLPDEEDADEDEDLDEGDDVVEGQIVQLPDLVQCVLDALPDIVGTTHAASIVNVVLAGIANGYPDGTFRPGDEVTRGQMATFIARALELTPPEVAGGGLTDVAGTTHAASIDAVVGAGIAQGYPDGTFRPGDEVTRGQMATFIARALELAPGEAGALSDAAGSVHAETINALAEAGITVGYPDGTFRPDVSVIRGQMASFLDRALEL